MFNVWLDAYGHDMDMRHVHILVLFSFNYFTVKCL